MNRSFEFLDLPPIRISAKDTPIPFARVLEQETIPSVRRIVDTVLAARKWAVPAA